MECMVFSLSLAGLPGEGLSFFITFHLFFSYNSSSFSFWGILLLPSFLFSLFFFLCLTYHQTVWAFSFCIFSIQQSRKWSLDSSGVGVGVGHLAASVACLLFSLPLENLYLSEVERFAVHLWRNALTFSQFVRFCSCYDFNIFMMVNEFYSIMYVKWFVFFS